MDGPAPRLVLASRSPQRRGILERLGVPFETRPTDVVEAEEGVPATVAAQNALRKAVAAERRPGEVVLGVDTVVAIGADMWGKPPDEDAARRTLEALGGRTHDVVSAIALIDADGVVHARHATTRVTFRALDEATIAWYARSGEWRDRAGGYAIQGRGAALVARIDGDYLNVVGLPVATLLEVWPDLLALAGRG